MRFHPTRLSHQQHRAFIPFGYGPLRCIAFEEAPRFAAIVAASTSTSLGQDIAWYAEKNWVGGTTGTVGQLKLVMIDFCYGISVVEECDICVNWNGSRMQAGWSVRNRACLQFIHNRSLTKKTGFK